MAHIGYIHTLIYLGYSLYTATIIISLAAAVAAAARRHFKKVYQHTDTLCTHSLGDVQMEVICV